MCTGKFFRDKQPYHCQSSWPMPAYGRWPVRRPVGLTRPAQSPGQPRKECAEISGNEPISPACDPAIGHFSEALQDGGRSWAVAVLAQCKGRTHTVLPSL